MALQAGRLFGNYRVVRQIGEGAFGEVYLAENPLIERRAAIKVLRPMLAQDTELVRRFFNEARAASAIRHPNIIEIHDAGETPEGVPYILMEFLEGTSLKQRLATVGSLSVAQAMEIADQAGSALSAAHAIGIVHRDLKPENLFLVPDASAPGGERVKILDFGIAKVKRSGGGSGSVRTESGLIMGSPTYMSPEQCRDSSDVDLRSDIYSFATIFYEMLAGRPPYLAGTGVELLLMHLSESPQPLRTLVNHVPSQMDDAVMRALRRERSDRFAEVESFLRALRESPSAGPTAPWRKNTPTVGEMVAPRIDRTIAGPVASSLALANSKVVAESDSPTHRVRRFSGRRLGLTLGGLVVLGIGVFWFLHRGHDRLPAIAHESAVAAAIAPAIAPVIAPAIAPLLPRLTERPDPAVLAGAADAGAPPPVTAPTNVPAPHAEHVADGTRARRELQAQAVRGKRVATVPKRGLTKSLSPDAHDQEDIAGF